MCASAHSIVLCPLGANFMSLTSYFSPFSVCDIVFFTPLWGVLSFFYGFSLIKVIYLGVDSLHMDRRILCGFYAVGCC